MCFRERLTSTTWCLFKLCRWSWASEACWQHGGSSELLYRVQLIVELCGFDSTALVVKMSMSAIKAAACRENGWKTQWTQPAEHQTANTQKLSYPLVVGHIHAGLCLKVHQSVPVSELGTTPAEEWDNNPHASISNLVHSGRLAGYKIRMLVAQQLKWDFEHVRLLLTDAATYESSVWPLYSCSVNLIKCISASRYSRMLLWVVL